MIRKTCCFVVFTLGFMMTGWSMPSRSDLKKVQSTVNELMADDIVAMKGGKKTPADAAAKALEYAGVATDEASKFLLYKGAFGLFVQGGRYDEAIAALDALTANVKNVPDKVVADIVREKLKKISKKDGGAIFEYYSRVDRRMRYGEEKAKLEKQVKANPSDKDAQRSLAQTHAALGDWSAALAAFAALGGDDAKAAKAEQGGKLAEAADFWWGYSVAGDEDLQDEFRAHAASLYAQAVRDGKLGGLKKALAEKRMAEFAPKASAPAPQPEVATRRESAPKAAAPAAPAASAANGKPIILDLGGGERLEMLPCPAGEFNFGDPQNRFHPVDVHVKISRPFWLARLPVTRDQMKRIDGKRPVMNGDRFIGTGKAPATCISAPDAWKLCRQLTKRFAAKIPKGYVIRLPTEAEWEYACTAGKTDETYSNPRMTFDEVAELGPGPLMQRDALAAKYGEKKAFSNIREGFYPAPGFDCGLKKPNRWGFQDMLGNVFEMTLDCFPDHDALHDDARYQDATDPIYWNYTPGGKDVEALLRGGCGYVLFDAKRCNCALGKFMGIPHNGWTYTQRTMRVAIAPDLLTERKLPQPK